MSVAQLLLLLTSAAASAPWTLQIGKSGYDRARALKVDSQNNVIVAGDTDGDLTDDWSNQGGRDSWVLKLDSTGVELWTAFLGGDGEEELFALQVDASDNVFATGFTDSSSLDNVSHYSGDGTYEMFITKLDGATGSTLWTLRYGESGGIDHRQYGRALQVDSAGNAYVTGRSEGELLEGQSFGGIDFFIKQVNANGTLGWTLVYGWADDDYPRGLKVDSNGDFIVAGFTYSDVGGQTNAGQYDTFVVKFDANHNVLWQNLFGGSSVDSAQGLEVDVDDNIYVSGSTSSSSFNGHSTSGNFDLFLLKLDANGNHLWTLVRGTTSADWAYAMKVVGTAIYVTGKTGGALGEAHIGSDDIFVMQVDTSGTYHGTEQLGTSDSDIAYAIEVDSSGQVIVAGLTDGDMDASHTNPDGNYDVVVIHQAMTTTSTISTSSTVSTKTSSTASTSTATSSTSRTSRTSSTSTVSTSTATSSTSRTSSTSTDSTSTATSSTSRTSRTSSTSTVSTSTATSSTSRTSSTLTRTVSSSTRSTATSSSSSTSNTRSTSTTKTNTVVTTTSSRTVSTTETGTRTIVSETMTVTPTSTSRTTSTTQSTGTTMNVTFTGSPAELGAAVSKAVERLKEEQDESVRDMFAMANRTFSNETRQIYQEDVEGSQGQLIRNSALIGNFAQNVTIELETEAEVNISLPASLLQTLRGGTEDPVVISVAVVVEGSPVFSLIKTWTAANQELLSEPLMVSASADESKFRPNSNYRMRRMLALGRQPRNLQETESDVVAAVFPSKKPTDDDADVDCACWDSDNDRWALTVPPIQLSGGMVKCPAQLGCLLATIATSRTLPPAEVVADESPAVWIMIAISAVLVLCCCIGLCAYRTGLCGRGPWRFHQRSRRSPHPDIEAVKISVQDPAPYSDAKQTLQDGCPRPTLLQTEEAPKPPEASRHGRHGPTLLQAEEAPKPPEASSHGRQVLKVPDATRSAPSTPQGKHIMLSGRFNAPWKIEYISKVHDFLQAKGAPVFMVEAKAGEGFGPKTIKGLTRASVMAAFCTDDYGAKTGAGYETFEELKFAWDHKLPIIPVQMCQEFPPQPPDEDGCDQNLFILRKDLIRVVDIEATDPERVADELFSAWSTLYSFDSLALPGMVAP